MEGGLKQFLAAADEPAAPMDAIIAATSEVANQVKSGAPVTKSDVGQIIRLFPAVGESFDKVYELFKTAKLAGVDAIEQVQGEVPAGKSRGPRKPPADYSGIPDAEVVKGIADMVPKFKTTLATVKDLGSKLVAQVSTILNDIDAEKSDGAEGVKAMVPLFLEFRDAVSPYYAIRNSMTKRVNQLLTSVGSSKTAPDAAGDAPVGEGLFIISPEWEEFGEYDDSMLERRAMQEATPRPSSRSVGREVTIRIDGYTGDELVAHLKKNGAGDWRVTSSRPIETEFTMVASEPVDRDVFDDALPDRMWTIRDWYEEGRSMNEAKKTKVEAKKKNGKDEIPEGAVGNLPAPSGAPPIGVENKISLPPMMQVERLVRSLKDQIIEGLK
jgi:hypothetical protein